MTDEDKRRLIPMQIKKVGENLYSIDIDGMESYKVEGSIDEIKRALRRIKAKDGETCGKCKSKKVNTYSSMIGEGDDELHKINVWKSKIPHTANDFKNLMIEGVNMKQVILTKNYLLEGNIIPKGTIIQFKEKLDFLPTDIWNGAKDITDEHERFEFIKSELNKLGNDYTDDEIEDFINKYKSDLNESKITENKLLEEVDGLNDMLDLIKDYLKSQKFDDKDIELILDKSKKHEKLISAWNNLLDADDNSFVKKERLFWTIFDELCDKFKDE